MLEEKKEQIFSRYNKLKGAILKTVQEDSGTIKEDVSEMLEQFEYELKLIIEEEGK